MFSEEESYKNHKLSIIVQQLFLLEKKNKPKKLTKPTNPPSKQN